MLVEFHALRQGWSGNILHTVRRRAVSRFVGLRLLLRGRNTAGEIRRVVALYGVNGFEGEGLEGTLTVYEGQGFPQECK